MKVRKKKIVVHKKDKLDLKKYIERVQPKELNDRLSTEMNTLKFKSDIYSPTHTDIHNSSNILVKPRFSYLFTSGKEENNNNFESFKTCNRTKTDYSEKIKNYRKNLDKIVNKLNESNLKYKNIVNKENINLNNELSLYYSKTPKYTINNYQNNILNRLDTNTYNHRIKNNILKNFVDINDIRKYRTINDQDNNNNTMKFLTHNNINDINSPNNDGINSIYKLRNEFNKISSNYMEVSQQIDFLNNSLINNNSISYEEILRNNSKINDILNYDYKKNNDSENEKVFILMKLRLKNAEIIINKLENENKKHAYNINKYNNLSKINNRLENENRNLKNVIEELNININSIKKEVEDYQIKFNNLELANKKILEKNVSLTNEIEKTNINENIIKQLKEKCNNISKENKNLKILLTDFQNKYRILQDIHLELKQKLNEKKCSEFKILKNENINIIKKYNNDDNNISELIKGKNKENKLKSINNLIEEKNNMENKKMNKNEEDNKNLKAKELFSGFYKKFTNDKLKENKLKMIIGIYLQKQKNDFNKFIKEYKDKNKKLLKSVRKLNDQIVEYKLNKINNNNIDNSNSENA